MINRRERRAKIIKKEFKSNCFKTNVDFVDSAKIFANFAVTNQPYLFP